MFTYVMILKGKRVSNTDVKLYVSLYTVGKLRCNLFQDTWMSAYALAFVKKQEL